ncbi:hypothetical protein ACIO3O_36115 [Streptomyces sp. NPDC087440]|uniref:hypothetical protein n=1 Tax=Streptomyces sp. NPDC087440 TaxID=3365790 RepID=UPI00382C8112
MTIAARVRPLDDLALKLLLGWLEHRRTRWPNATNLHLLINNQTANRPQRWSGSASTGSSKKQ